MMIASTATLRITEIFYSVQGESRHIGRPTVFVRLTGCPLRCSYCDTAYAFEGGELWSLQKIIDTVSSYNCPHVTVTGGEPLAQRNCLELLRLLCDQDYEVSLETSGALAIDAVDRRVSRVVDLKTPGSAEQSRNLWENIDQLHPGDQLKFVICNRDDYEWARKQVRERKLAERVDDVLFSPSWGQIEAALLAEWVLADRLPVRLQLQLHKLLWGEERGR